MFWVIDLVINIRHHLQRATQWWNRLPVIRKTQWNNKLWWLTTQSWPVCSYWCRITLWLTVQQRKKKKTINRHFRSQLSAYEFEKQHNLCHVSRNQQREQLPWGNDGTERFQHLSCSQPQLRVQHQQLSDQAHSVLWHSTIPAWKEREWQKTLFIRSMWLLSLKSLPLLLQVQKRPKLNVVNSQQMITITNIFQIKYCLLEDYRSIHIVLASIMPLILKGVWRNTWWKLINNDSFCLRGKSNKLAVSIT